MMNELIKIAKDKAIKLGSGIGKLYDLYGKTYEENSDKVKKHDLEAFINLVNTINEISSVLNNCGAAITDEEATVTHNIKAVLVK